MAVSPHEIVEDSAKHYADAIVGREHAGGLAAMDQLLRRLEMHGRTLTVEEISVEIWKLRAELREQLLALSPANTE